MTLPAVLACSVGLVTLAHGQDTLKTILHKIEVGRSSFPPTSASFSETVIISGTEVPLQAGSTSWGGRNGTREFRNYVNEGAILYETNSHFGNMPSKLPPMPRKFYRDKSAVTSIDMLSRTGEIEEDHEFPFPLGFCYWVNGRPVDDVLRDLDSPKVSETTDGWVIVGTMRGVPMEFTLSKEQVPALLRLDIGNGDAVWVLEASERLDDHRIATKVLCTIHSRNPVLSGTAQHIFEILGSVEHGSKEIALKWIDGMRVYDRVNDRIFRVQNGKLVGDPLFTMESRGETSQRFVYFMAGGTIIVLAGLASFLKFRSK